jgi:hypothetical protein
MLDNKNKEVERLTEALYAFQNSLFDFSKDIIQDKKIQKNEFGQILKFYGMLDDFVLNVESLKMEIGEFCLGKD